jgi:hypothetical protein
MKSLLSAFAASLLLSAPSSAIAPPTVTSISTLAQLQTPLPFPYDEKSDADKTVDEALAKAKAEHKRAFIDLGGNWCSDCRVLTGVMGLPELKNFIDTHYVVAIVDVGRFNRNLQIPARWGMVDALKEGGAPAVLIVDPATNTVVNVGHTGALENSRHMTPQAIADWIAKWAK